MLLNVYGLFLMRRSAARCSLNAGKFFPDVPPPSVRLLYKGIAYPTLYHIVLFYRLPCDSCSACLLPTVHPGNALQLLPYKN